MAYEADVVVVLNDKWDVVSKNHLAYDRAAAEAHKHVVVFTVEKNREGVAGVDLEFGKDFEHYRFDPAGRYVSEQLVDERLTPNGRGTMLATGCGAAW
ncbi:MAG: hypothetical protein ACRDVM_09545 [Acidimicrobiia bacterium]